MSRIDLQGTARVIAVSRREEHAFSKAPQNSIRLLAGLGVDGDAHCGVTVKHRSRVAVDPTQPNLRQVHLLESERLGELAAAGFDLAAGDLGENMLTQGIDLLALPRGTRLSIGPEAVVEITGLRNPCRQIDDFRPGLLGRLVHKDEAGVIIRRAGVMGIVLAGGEVRIGDTVVIGLPAKPFEVLDRV